MKVKIKFSQAVAVQDNHGTVYTEGQVVDLEERSANHWLTRGKAKVWEEVTQGKARAVKAIKAVQGKK